MNENLYARSSQLDSIALFGRNSTANHLARLFSSVGLQVYLISADDQNPTSSNSTITNGIVLNDKDDLPYLSSVLINCQNEFLPIETFLNSFPLEYKQRMAYIECSTSMRGNGIEILHQQMNFGHYLCLNLIELDSSTMSEPRLHLICSGDEIVFQKLIFQTHLPAKITFLSRTKTPFDSFYLCLFHRYSQAIHWAIYAEIFAIFKAANSIYPGQFQFLFDWSFVKRPLMRQIILRSPSSSLTLTTINEFQFLLESFIGCFFNNNEENHLKILTGKLIEFLSALDRQEKEKAIFELFHFY